MKKTALRFLLPALVSLFGACGGQEGTIAITVVGAPDSELLPRIESLRATLSNPLTVFEGQRDANGVLNIEIDLKADGRSGDLVVEGFDADDELIAIGRVGPLPLAAIDAEVNVYLGPPLGLAEAPVRLDPPRSDMGSTAASFGVLFAGGVGVDGVLADVDVYSTYLHTLQSGADMPEPLSEVSVARGSAGFIYMLGGRDSEGTASARSFAFDTTRAPAGSYRDMVMAPEHARAGKSMTIVGQDLYLVAGDPGLLLDGFQGTARPLQNGDALDGVAVTVVAGNNLQVIFAGADVESGAALFELNQIRRVSAPAELLRRRHRGLQLPTNEALFVGGSLDDVATTTAVVYKPSSTSFQVVELLATPRLDPAIAITDRYLVVAGGESDTGEPIGDVEVFDASTLEPVTVLPLQVPRRGASAQALSNGQVLVAGGIDESGAPVDVLELFTPDQ